MKVKLLSKREMNSKNRKGGGGQTIDPTTSTAAHKNLVQE